MGVRCRRSRRRVLLGAQYILQLGCHRSGHSRGGCGSNAFGIAPQPAYFTSTPFSSAVVARFSASMAFSVRMAARLAWASA